MGILLPNNQRQHRTLHTQRDVLPYALCYSLCPMSAALGFWHSTFSTGSIENIAFWRYIDALLLIARPGCELIFAARQKCFKWIPEIDTAVAEGVGESPMSG
jgi:hypothetical protein